MTLFYLSNISSTEASEAEKIHEANSLGKHKRLRNLTVRRQNNWLFISVAEKLNVGFNLGLQLVCVLILALLFPTGTFMKAI